MVELFLFCSMLDESDRFRVFTGIWQILLDFSGGLLSDLQLVGDCWSSGDWTGITGNLAKLLLGFVSITFDTIFMLQHYVWFAERDESLLPDALMSNTGDIIEALL